MLLSAVMAIRATFLHLPAVLLGTRAVQHWVRLPAVTAAAAPLFTPSNPARACVSRHGPCPIGPVRADDPCSCPDPLLGSMAGHVEPVAGPLVRAHSRDWPSGEAAGPLFGP